MKLSTVILTSILTALVRASCSLDNGNYYCSNVDAVKYTNVGYSGSYSDVTNMDETTCECTQESVSFSGTNSPLDEELSVHFRGPVKLLQFGVYYPSSSSSKVKRDADADCLETRHIHHQHKREAAVEVVEVTSTVYVNADGELVTSAATNTEVAAASTTNTAATVSVPAQNDENTSSSTTTLSPTTSAAASSSSPTTTTIKTSSSSSSTAAAATSSSSSSGSSSGAWVRSSYYTPGSTDNLTFMNTLGGVTSSGVWSSCFGNSISYAAANGVDASSSAVALNEVTTSSDDEYIIFSGASCDDGDDGCGYYRSDIPAYHGFSGAEKIFVFEFEMPHDSSSSGASNPDMPAIWLLNAKIPRTLQYGSSSCSCWSTGCGELDLFEVLSEGDERLISHIHDGQGNDKTSTGGGGSQDYFTRPTDSSMKAAVIFSSDGSIQIVKVDDSTDFGSSLSSSTVDSWLDVTGGSAALS